MRRLFLTLCLLVVVGVAHAAPKEFFLIDFFTQRGDRSIHGTLSLIDGVTKATWTVQTKREKTTYETALTEEDFRGLWDRMSDLPSLKNFAVADPDTKLSFTGHYVVGIIYSFSGGQGQRTFLIPHESKVKDAASWVQQIESRSKRR